MTLRSIILAAIVVSHGLLSSGCGSKDREVEDRERERLELEEKARREAEAANKAITDVNRRMFRKKPGETTAAPAGEETAATDDAKAANPVTPDTAVAPTP